jgi:cell division protein FtsI/penicillin-binding protein 2
VSFDVPEQLVQSSAYRDTSGQQQILNNSNLLAESGFGQGQLFITPLTMEEISATIASSAQTYNEKLPTGGVMTINSTPGTLYDPHVMLELTTHRTTPSTPVSLIQPPTQPQAYTGGPIIRPETTAAVRQAMWAVASAGTGATVANPSPNAGYNTLAESPVQEGGKTGTAQTDQPNPRTWWISLAPDDAASGNQPAKMAITVMKEDGGEGACQVFVADDTYAYAMSNHIGPYGG